MNIPLEDTNAKCVRLVLEPRAFDKVTHEKREPQRVINQRACEREPLLMYC